MPCVCCFFFVIFCRSYISISFWSFYLSIHSLVIAISHIYIHSIVCCIECICECQPVCDKNNIVSTFTHNQRQQIEYTTNQQPKDTTGFIACIELSLMPMYGCVLCMDVYRERLCLKASFGEINDVNVCF